MKRRDLENEADLLRDIIFRMCVHYPEAEHHMDEILARGLPKTEMCLKLRLQDVDDLLKGYFRSLQHKAAGKTSRTYLRQGMVDDSR